MNPVTENRLADAFRDRRIRGATVYVLSSGGAASEADRRLARQENEALGSVELKGKDKMLAEVLVDAELATGDADTLLETGVTSAFFPHGLGHLLGVQVHDVGGFMENESGTAIDPPSGHPFLRLTRVLEEDMVLTIEPGLYVIDMLLDNLRGTPAEDRVNWNTVNWLRPFGGIRIEDNVRVLVNDRENLTRDAFARL